MVGIIKESGISPVLTFHLFNLSCVGEVVQLNFLLFGRDCIFLFPIRDDQDLGKFSHKRTAINCSHGSVITKGPYPPSSFISWHFRRVVCFPTTLKRKEIRSTDFRKNYLF